MLSAFLKWLNDKYVIDHRHIKDENDTGFYVRFHIQKCMYMAQILGLGAGYEYHQYVYGPYSRDLAAECYEYDPDAPVRWSLPLGFTPNHRSVVLRAHSGGSRGWR